MSDLKDVAGSTIDALKSQPVLLALVVLQVVQLGVVAWASTANRAGDRERFGLVMQLCGPKQATE